MKIETNSSQAKWFRADVFVRVAGYLPMRDRPRLAVTARQAYRATKPAALSCSLACPVTGQEFTGKDSR